MRNGMAFLFGGAQSEGGNMDELIVLVVTPGYRSAPLMGIPYAPTQLVKDNTRTIPSIRTHYRWKFL